MERLETGCGSKRPTLAVAHGLSLRRLAWVVVIFFGLAGGLGTSHAAPTVEELDELIAALDSSDYQVRMMACREVSKKARALLDADSGTAAAPGSVKSKLIHFFDAALSDGSQNVVREALRAATQTPLAAVWAHLKEFIQRKRGNVTALTRVIAVQAFAELTLLLDKSKPSDEEETSSVTGRSGVNELEVVLVGDPAPSVRSAAALGIATLDEPSGIEVLEDAVLAESNPTVLSSINIALDTLEGTFRLCPATP